MSYKFLLQYSCDDVRINIVLKSNGTFENRGRIQTKNINKERKKIYGKQWREQNKEHLKERAKKYYQANRDIIDAYNTKWAKNNPEKRKAISKKCNDSWSSKHPDRRRELDLRKRNKRCEIMSFNPINKYFPGSNGHHLNKDDVIYIPEELHKSIGHSVIHDRNMTEINNASFEWLCMQEAI